MTRQRAAGFTLLEVLVALVLGGWILLVAGRVFVSISDAVARLTEIERKNSARHDAEALLRILFEHADPSVDALAGTATSVRVGSWCEEARGWLEHCTATVGVVELSDGLALAAAVGNRDPVFVRRGLRTAHVGYVRSGAGGGVWSAGWSATTGIPVAVAFVLDRDTILVRVGNRS